MVLVVVLVYVELYWNSVQVLRCLRIALGLMDTGAKWIQTGHFDKSKLAAPRPCNVAVPRSSKKHLTRGIGVQEDIKKACVQKVFCL